MAGNPTQGLQDEFLNTIRVGQEAVIEGIRTCVETVQSVTPKLPLVHVPLADKLPKPEEVVASAYDFAEKLLASQRKFAEEVLSVTAPLAEGTHKADGTAKADGPQKADSGKKRAASTAAK
jgi:hypothetical protein